MVTFQILEPRTGHVYNEFMEMDDFINFVDQFNKKYEFTILSITK